MRSSDRSVALLKNWAPVRGSGAFTGRGGCKRYPPAHLREVPVVEDAADVDLVEGGHGRRGLPPQAHVCPLFCDDLRGAQLVEVRAVAGVAGVAVPVRGVGVDEREARRGQLRGVRLRGGARSVSHSHSCTSGPPPHPTRPPSSCAPAGRAMPRGSRR